MANSTTNPGQFGQRDDTVKQAKKGGEASSSQQDMSALGKRGAAAQSSKAKAEGGRNSHRGNSNS